MLIEGREYISPDQATGLSPKLQFIQPRAHTCPSAYGHVALDSHGSLNTSAAPQWTAKTLAIRRQAGSAISFFGSLR